jgi:hypothetical protein
MSQRAATPGRIAASVRVAAVVFHHDLGCAVQRAPRGQPSGGLTAELGELA